MNAITVEQAEQVIQQQVKDYGNETVPYMRSLGRVLGEDLYADRDLPPFNRATVDGIAIKAAVFNSGVRTFSVTGLQAAGDQPVAIQADGQCVEIMTGAAVDLSLDAVVRYEDITMENGTATVREISVTAGLHLHTKGKDKRQGELVAGAHRVIDAALIGLAASIGKTSLSVKRLPRVAILSTGDEMVPPEAEPTAYQLRRSNGAVIKSVLEKYSIQAGLFHLNDDIGLMRTTLTQCLREYDVLLTSGGVSMGKFDYMPRVLEELSVQKMFHKVRQRPGKPFWFGRREEKLIFAFPGNPVSAFLCLHRYFIPWLERSLGIVSCSCCMAVLERDIDFTPPLQYFVEVRLRIGKDGALVATPFERNGSGDFSNLIDANAFMELPLGQDRFQKGALYKVWRYRN